MEPLDLTLAPPRSPYDELEHLVFLPRTIDKFRASLPGGNVGQYFAVNGAILGMSGYLLQCLGVTEDELRAKVASAKCDGCVVDWLKERSDASTWPQISETIKRIRIKHTQDQSVFREIYAPTLEANPDLDNVLEIIVADDKRMFEVVK
jgi:hypothetical protein